MHFKIQIVGQTLGHDDTDSFPAFFQTPNRCGIASDIGGAGLTHLNANQSTRFLQYANSL